MKKRLALLLLLLLAALAVAGCGSSSGKEAYDLGTVVMGPGMTFAPDKLEGPTGRFRLKLENKDSQLHDFAVDGTSVMKQVLAGQTGVVEFEISKPGMYSFTCTQPGHKDSGMKGTLVVR